MPEHYRWPEMPARDAKTAGVCRRRIVETDSRRPYQVRVPGNQRAPRQCARCRVHGVEVLLGGHDLCPHRDCQCLRCRRLILRKKCGKYPMLASGRKRRAAAASRVAQSMSIRGTRTTSDASNASASSVLSTASVFCGPCRKHGLMVRLEQHQDPETSKGTWTCKFVDCSCQRCTLDPDDGKVTTTSRQGGGDESADSGRSPSEDNATPPPPPPQQRRVPSAKKASPTPNPVPVPESGPSAAGPRHANANEKQTRRRRRRRRRARGAQRVPSAGTLWSQVWACARCKIHGTHRTYHPSCPRASCVCKPCRALSSKCIRVDFVSADAEVLLDAVVDSVALTLYKRKLPLQRLTAKPENQANTASIPGLAGSLVQMLSQQGSCQGQGNAVSALRLQLGEDMHNPPGINDFVSALKNWAARKLFGGDRDYFSVPKPKPVGQYCDANAVDAVKNWTAGASIDGSDCSSQPKQVVAESEPNRDEGRAEDSVGGDGVPESQLDLHVRDKTPPVTPTRNDTKYSFDVIVKEEVQDDEEEAEPQSRVDNMTRLTLSICLMCETVVESEDLWNNHTCIVSDAKPALPVPVPVPVPAGESPKRKPPKRVQKRRRRFRAAVTHKTNESAVPVIVSVSSLSSLEKDAVVPNFKAEHRDDTSPAPETNVGAVSVIVSPARRESVDEKKAVPVEHPDDSPVTQEVRYYCEDCGWSSRNITKLSVHRVTDHLLLRDKAPPSPPRACPLCPGLLPMTSVELEQHSAELHGAQPDVACPQCGLAQHDSDTLSEHMWREHKSPFFGSQTRSCVECGEQFYDARLLRAHEEQHMELLPISRVEVLAASFQALKLIATTPRVHAKAVKREKAARM